MDKIMLKELFEQNTGDIVIKTKDREFNVISHILSLVSPAFKKEIENSITRTIDLSFYYSDNVETMLKYIYFKDMSTDTNLYDANKLCDIVHLFDLCNLIRPKISLLLQMGEIRKKNFIFAALNEFSKYDDGLFSIIRKKYCDHIIKVMRSNIKHECFDKGSDSKHRWCCKHTIKKADNRYVTYEINNTFGCICTNLKKRSNVDESLKYYQEDKFDPNKYFVDRCCEHRKLDVEIDDEYNYDELLKLDKETADSILRDILKPN